ncbi:hypothetical protein ACFVFS_35385, partial [Kitasatospora sp. NPDC057692]
MSTSTGGNGARGGETGIQLPSMDWEMEEEAAAPAVSAASVSAATGPVTAEAPTEQVAVPQYGPATPSEPAVLPEAEPDYGPGEEPGALEPVAVEGEYPDGHDPEEEPGRRRFRRPALVAAATAGVVLMGLPFLITDGADGAKDKKGDGRGVNQADHQLVDGPEIGEVPVPPAPTDPPVTGVPTPTPTDAAAPTGETVPGIALPPGVPAEAAVPLVPGSGTQPNQGTQSGGAPAGKSSTGGGSSNQQSGGGKTVQQPAAGQQPAPPAAGQQPAPPATGQQPAPPPAGGQQ